YCHDRSGTSLYSNSLSDITQDATGNIWLTYRNGMVEKLDIGQNKITYRTDIFTKAVSIKDAYYAITVDKDSDLWFYAPNF
ncbi:hypothetical protein ACCD01_31875, partial [Telluria sp. Tellsp99]